MFQNVWICVAFTHFLTLGPVDAQVNDILRDAELEAATIQHEDERSRVLREIAIANARAGDAARASKTAQQIPDYYERVLTTVGIANVQIQSERIEAAQQTLELALADLNRSKGDFRGADAQVHIAVAFARAGNVGRARELGKSASERGWDVSSRRLYIEIAAAVARRGNVDAVLGAVASLPEDVIFGKDSVLQDISLILADDGLKEEATLIAKGMRDKKRVSSTLEQLAQRKPDPLMGSLDEIRHNLDYDSAFIGGPGQEGLDTAHKKIVDALKALGANQIDEVQGFLREAFAALAPVRPSGFHNAEGSTINRKLPLLYALVSLQTHLDGTDGWRRTTEVIRRDYDDKRVFRTIARIQSRKKTSPSRPDWIQREASPTARAYALLGTAEGILDRVNDRGEN